jgi:RNA polymerase sigma factor FliA
MNSATPSMLPGLTSYVTQAPARPLTIHSALRHSAPPRLSIVPGTLTIVARLPARPTLPPGVRAARMMSTVRKVASRMARRLPRHVDIEDLIGAGSLGLADAFSRRGTMPGSEFEAFAAFRIRGAMLDELRRLDSMPRRSRRSAKALASACSSIEQKLGRPATEEEVAGELGIEMSEYQALRSKIDASRSPVPLSALATDDEDVTHDVADPKDEGPDALAARAQIGKRIAEKVNDLPERMRVVLMGIYVEGTTLKQIGLLLGVSESRVCQIHTEALAALRSTLGATNEDSAPPSRTARATRDEAPVSRVSRKTNATTTQASTAACRMSRAS